MVLEYSPLQTASFTARSTRPRPDSVATADQWHQRLGHIGPEALAHLPTSVTGAELIDGPPLYNVKYAVPARPTRLFHVDQRLERQLHLNEFTLI
jgi:hypothetical protein